MSVVRDHLWVWGHEAGSHNDQFNLPGCSRMTPVEAAVYLDVPNMIMVGYGGKPEPPFTQYALPMRRLEQVVWSIVGDASSKRNDEQTDLDEVLALAERYPNVTGAIMDDFFHNEMADVEHVARYRPRDIAYFQQRLHAAPRPLDLWVVVYEHQLHLPMSEHLRHCDVVSFWTWEAKDLPKMGENFARMEAISPETRKVLGCYLWDYGVGAPMPLDMMRYQCEQGLDWLQAGRIEGMIFLASCICDLNLEAVEWTREWIARVGGQDV